jgi:hypothetical protein
MVRRFDRRGVPLVFGKTQVRTDSIVAAFKMADNRLACEAFVEFQRHVSSPLVPKSTSRWPGPAEGGVNRRDLCPLSSLPGDGEAGLRRLEASSVEHRVRADPGRLTGGGALRHLSQDPIWR